MLIGTAPADLGVFPGHPGPGTGGFRAGRSARPGVPGCRPGPVPAASAFGFRPRGHCAAMVAARVHDVLPEWDAFVHAVRARRPGDGTWCEAWTVRDVLIHQTGNAEELAR